MISIKKLTEMGLTPYGKYNVEFKNKYHPMLSGGKSIRPIGGVMVKSFVSAKWELVSIEPTNAHAKAKWKGPMVTELIKAKKRETIAPEVEVSKKEESIADKVKEVFGKKKKEELAEKPKRSRKKK